MYVDPVCHLVSHSDSDSPVTELKTIIHAGAKASGYMVDRWTSRIVADLIRKKWGVDYSSSNVRRILQSLGLSYQKPDVKSTKHSSAAAEHWQRYVWPRIKKKRRQRLRRDFMG